MRKEDEQLAEMFITLKGLKIISDFPSNLNFVAHNFISFKWKSNKKVPLDVLCKTLGSKVHVFCGCVASPSSATLYFTRTLTDKQAKLVQNMWGNL